MRTPRFIIRWLQKWARYIIANRDPDQIIGPRKQPYMLRWHVFRTKYFGGLYIHLFLADDDDRALHDHPFASLSFVIDGEMREIYAQRGWNPSNKQHHSVRMFRGRDIVWRRAEFAHRMELLTPSALTFFFIGPNVRQWGFWCEKIGWRHWREYCDTEDEGLIGKGCD